MLSKIIDILVKVAELVPVAIQAINIFKKKEETAENAEKEESTE